VDSTVDKATGRERILSVLIWGAILVAISALGPIFGFVRTSVALLIFGVLAYLGARQVRSMMTNLPEPEVEDISNYGLKYVCTMCGLELKIEVAARDKAPTHCMEPMELVLK
jgi:hypothetical protein